MATVVKDNDDDECCIYQMSRCYVYLLHAPCCRFLRTWYPQIQRISSITERL